MSWRRKGFSMKIDVKIIDGKQVPIDSPISMIG